MDRIASLVKEYRTAEFVKLSRLIMLLVGAPTIVFWSIMDYQEWGFKPFWMLLRASFPLYAVFCVYLTKLPLFNSGCRHHLPFLLYTGHILLFCSYFISQSGYAQSRYLVGMPQIILSMSFLPFGVLEFIIVALVYSVVPILVATRGLTENSLFAGPAFQLYFTYSMFAVLTYFVVDFIRKTSFLNKALLFLEKESQLNVIENQAREISESRVSVAIAATVQMLAHDVRKPFSILKMGLGMLGNAKDPAGVKSILSRLVPEIDKSVRSVDGMIADVMEIGSTSNQLIQEPASPESLIESALGEIFRMYPKSNIAIKYTLEHSNPVNVHVNKVGRVLSNIVGNAVQAMNYSGVIWFKTRQHDGFIEFCVGNAGSFIPLEHLPKLFEAFFTSGKKGGTGLGLAIAQKVVTAHGGKIWCESKKTAEHPAGKVEFFFTLPIFEGKSKAASAPLPTQSSEIIKAILAVSHKAEVQDGVDTAELTLEADIVSSSKRLGRPIRVLVVDDEAIYRSAFTAFLSRTPDLAGALSVNEADGSDSALALISVQHFDLIVTDVDMGTVSLTGFELVHKLAKDLRVSAMICVHSNRIVAADHKTAMDCGADAFLPKPMARAHLLKLVLQAEQKAERVEQDVAPSGLGSDPKEHEVLIVDDNAFILSAWQEMLGSDVVVHVIDSPEALRTRLAQEPNFLARLTCVITDNHFDGSSGDGIDVGRIVKSKAPSMVVFLSSDGEFSGTDFQGAIDCLIDKNPVPFAELPIGRI